EKGWGVRISLATVHGISDDEVARIAEGQPYTSLQDFYARAHPKLPTVERLISVGALDQVKGEATRRDLLLQATELHRQARTRPGTGQLPLATTPHTAEPSGLREMTARERLDAELGILHIDVSRHLMNDHFRLLREIGATDAKHLRAMHPGQRVLVAGVRASTQTPPIASGKRIIFVTLEDGSGLVDLAFFEDSHERSAHTVFHHGLLLVRGTVEARGPRRTVVGEMAWDLDRLAAARATHGPQAVLDLLGQAPSPTPAQPTADPAATRTIRDGTAGARLHPWSDLQPAGTRSADLTRFGHRSPGSAG
ncbi:OB-fold nucleic acid binding domain-containing protein, partial [Streptomyces californicus]|uniref:helix-hairpin-helix domain-containing protein n=1 Tax=Streptomyces californicus TaxID=67351 RepID=UPI0037AEEB3B